MRRGLDSASPAVGIGPFASIPRDGHGADGFEVDARIVAVDQADQAALKDRGAAGLVGDDVQDALGPALLPPTSRGRHRPVTVPPDHVRIAAACPKADRTSRFSDRPASGGAVLVMEFVGASTSAGMPVSAARPGRRASAPARPGQLVDQGDSRRPRQFWESFLEPHVAGSSRGHGRDPRSYLRHRPDQSSDR